jgi:hypothetical protein
MDKRGSGRTKKGTLLPYYPFILLPIYPLSFIKEGGQCGVAEWGLRIRDLGFRNFSIPN